MQGVWTAQWAGFVRAGPYYQSLILHNNAGPLGTAASLHAAKPNGLAIPNVTLLEAPWVNGSGKTDVTGGTPAWPYPELVEGSAPATGGAGSRDRTRQGQRSLPSTHDNGQGNGIARILFPLGRNRWQPLSVRRIV